MADILRCGIFAGPRVRQRGNASSASRSADDKTSHADAGVARWGATPLTPNSGDGRRALTPFQEEIAALVAQGLSNREIAERLAVTPEAVSDEIVSMFQLLGLTTRFLIAVWAIEHGSHR